MDFRALRFCDDQCCHDLIDLRRRANGAKVRVAVHWVTHNNMRGRLGDFRNERIEDWTVNKSPRPCDTALPRSAEIARDQTICGALQIGVVKDKNRGFPTQLKRGHGEVFSRIAHDMLCGFWSARKRDPVNIGVPCQRDCAIFSVASDDRNDALGKAGSLDQFGKREHRSRGYF